MPRLKKIALLINSSNFEKENNIVLALHMYENKKMRKGLRTD